MSRPETLDDVKERAIEVGDIRITEFTTKPSVLKAWASFVEAVVKDGGQVLPGKYSREQARVLVPRDEYSLQEQLRTEQYRWDELAKNYDICCVHGTPPENWQKDSMRDWCKAEGKPLVWLHAEIDKLTTT